MKTMAVKWTGIRPLLMTNPQTVRISNSYASRSRDLSRAMKDARKKGNEAKMVEIEAETLRNDWEASAYWDGSAFFVPDTAILACIRSGAMVSRRGKDIETAVLISETEARIEVEKGHNSLDAYFADPAFRLECPAKVPPKTGALIWKCRAMMPTGWSISFTAEYEESIIAKSTLVAAMQDAGTLKGLGGWRPKFGRFLVEAE
jgi:hypothetical protein